MPVVGATSFLSRVLLHHSPLCVLPFQEGTSKFANLDSSVKENQKRTQRRLQLQKDMVRAPGSSRGPWESRLGGERPPVPPAPSSAGAQAFMSVLPPPGLFALSHPEDLQERKGKAVLLPLDPAGSKH